MTLGTGSLIYFRRLLPSVLAVAILLPLVGCGSDRIEAGGRVTRKEGSPLVGARVTFRSSGGVNASGVTDQDGRFVLGGAKVGEGIPPGEYDVIVNEPRIRDGKSIPPTVSMKYINPTTSGLKFTVEPGGKNQYEFVLDPP